MVPVVEVAGEEPVVGAVLDDVAGVVTTVVDTVVDTAADEDAPCCAMTGSTGNVCRVAGAVTEPVAGPPESVAGSPELEVPPGEGLVPVGGPETPPAGGVVVVTRGVRSSACWSWAAWTTTPTNTPMVNENTTAAAMTAIR